jgi:ankyrin repeat protein
MKKENHPVLDKALQTASDRMFPDELGQAVIRINSRDANGDTPMHVFIWGGETDNALLLIENGADINAIGDMGETPLHAALHQRNHLVINALLKANARTDIVSEFGKSAVDLAKEIGVRLHVK